MIKDELKLEERSYANHKFDKDIALAEYNLSVLKLDGEEKSVLWTTNIVSFFIPAISYIGFSDFLKQDFYIFIIFYVVFTLLSVLHITSLVKSKILSERKIILIRRSFGVTYGSNSLILPSWRIEGADNPFSMRLFPGLLSYAIFPIYLIAFTGLFLGILVVPENTGLPKNIAVICAISYSFFVLFIFRFMLREQHENRRLWLARFLAWVFKMPLVSNLEYKIYKCHLDVSEANRIHANIELIKPIAIAIEDKSFYHHSGVNIRGIARAIRDRLRYGKKTGGSSITQQFVRSNFLLSLKPFWKRKIVEIFLARWIESVFSKELIIRTYLTTVRFDREVFGFHLAYRHFFNKAPKHMTKAEAFILVERLGNIRGLFMGNRVEKLLKRLLAEEVLDLDDIKSIIQNYKKLISKEIITQDGSITPKKIKDAIL